MAIYTARSGPIASLIRALLGLLVLIIVVWLLSIIFPGALTWWVHHLHLRGLGPMKAGKAFLFGFLQGFLFLVDWAVSLFRNNVHVFQHGAKSAYSLGFIIGLLLFIFGGFRSLWR